MESDTRQGLISNPPRRVWSHIPSAFPVSDFARYRQTSVPHIVRENRCADDTK